MEVSPARRSSSCQEVSWCSRRCDMECFREAVKNCLAPTLVSSRAQNEAYLTGFLCRHAGWSSSPAARIVDVAPLIEEGDQHECNIGFQLFWFLQHRPFRTFPLKPLRFVSVSYSKFDYSSLLMTIPRKFGSVSRRPRMSWHTSFSSFVTIFAQIFRMSKLPVIPESDSVHTQVTCDQSDSHFFLLVESLSLPGS